MRAYRKIELHAFSEKNDTERWYYKRKEKGGNAYIDGTPPWTS